MTTIIESIDTIRPSHTHATVDIAGVAWPVYKVGHWSSPQSPP